jgi:superfamily I DNA and/or RNA helicase
MEELKKLRQLLEIEKQEDIRQYQTQVILQPLHERRKKGFTWYPIQINHIEIGSGENYYLSIERRAQIDEPHVFQIGDSISLFFNSDKNKNPSLPGIITALWKNSMRVSFNVDEMPDWVDESNLGIDALLDMTTYQEMENALDLVSKAQNNRLAELRDLVYATKKAQFKAEKDIPDYLNVSALNSSQNQAVKNIIAANDVAIIHGPPGTGKTTTLVEAIKLTLQFEKQVLVTAPSNTAVDLLTELLLKKGVTVLRIGNPARIDEDLMNHSLEAQVAQHPDYKYLKKLRRDAEEFRKMANKYKRSFGPAEREQRKLLFAESHRMKDEATTLEKYIVDSLLNQHQVITATLVGSVNKFIRHRRFSTVFIDEAAQALEPACWIPISKSERVILAGDHCQLPPTIKSYEAAQAGLSETLFEKLIKTQTVAVMLETQYRMHEQIMGFSNQIFYQNRLSAAEKVKEWTLISHLNDSKNANSLDYLQTLEFIDTAGCSFDEQFHPETQSRFNPEENNLVIKHLTNLLQQLSYTYPSVIAENLSIGIISPYSAQVSFLKENLLAHPDLSEYKNLLQINSIDGFQGQERDIIYISLVRSNEKGQIGFLADTRRMNVALTRARKKLVVIGDSATLGQHSFYQSFLDYIEKIGAYRSAWEFQGE